MLTAASCLVGSAGLPVTHVSVWIDGQHYKGDYSFRLLADGPNVTTDSWSDPALLFLVGSSGATHANLADADTPLQASS